MSVITTLSLSNKQEDFEELKVDYDAVFAKYVSSTTCTYTEFSTFQYEKVPDPDPVRAEAGETVIVEDISIAYKYDIYKVVYP